MRCCDSSELSLSLSLSVPIVAPCNAHSMLISSPILPRPASPFFFEIDHLSLSPSLFSGRYVMSIAWPLHKKASPTRVGKKDSIEGRDRDDSGELIRQVSDQLVSCKIANIISRNSRHFETENQPYFSHIWFFKRWNAIVRQFICNENVPFGTNDQN